VSFAFKREEFEVEGYLEEIRDRAKFEQNPFEKLCVKEGIELIRGFVEKKPGLLLGLMFLEEVFSNGHTVYSISKKTGHPKIKVLREMAKTKRYIKRQMLLLTKNHFEKE